MKTPMTIVTGAAGMIGSGIIRHLNDLGISSILAVDDLKSSDKWKNLLGKQFVDLISKHQLAHFLQGRESEIDAIIHLGACSDTVETNVDYLLENNFRYTINLATWALRHKKRFIYASSAATYGDGSLGFADDESCLEELRPLNPYGFSKHLADLWMKREGILQDVVGLKYFNIFGPNEYHKGRMASMIYKMHPIVQRNEPVKLFKSNSDQFPDGGQMRDFLYVKDAVKMTCAFLLPQYRHVGGIFNIGRGETVTWNFLADSLFQAYSKKACIAYIDMPKELEKQYQNYTCAKMDKFHKIFGANYDFPVDQAVKDYVQKYLIKEARW
jgi:ADP-L-glycero-D-manno-heptose 6-epimerase